MSDDPMNPAIVSELAATVNLSIAEVDRVGIAALMASARAAVIRRADTLPIESPPALVFDPR
jgi:hypothetical protein